MTKKQLNPNIRLSRGNIKLSKNDHSIFLIWNIPAISTCPYATKECIRLCYARKAERQYPSCLPSRTRHWNESKKDTFVKDMIQAITYELDRRGAKGKRTYFRIHESGDFYTVEYARKWVEIARHFDGDDRISFLAYTKSLRFFRGLNKSKNFVLRYSLWDDTKPSEKAYYEKQENMPMFTAIPKGQAYDGKVCVGDCSICKACYTEKVVNIACEIH